MADIKISDLPAAASASGAMQLEVNDSASSKSVTVDQVKTYMLGAGSITATELGSNAVTTIKILDANVTTAKIADGAVSSIKITDGNVTPAKLSTGAPSWTAGGDLIVTGTGAVDVPSGTTAQRPAVPASGMVRYNTTLAQYEGYNGATWGALGGGATGGAGNAAFYENDKVITASYTLTSGKNAMSTGSITINAGVTVTVPSGSRWVVL